MPSIITKKLQMQLEILKKLGKLSTRSEEKQKGLLNLSL